MRKLKLLWVRETAILFFRPGAKAIGMGVLLGLFGNSMMLRADSLISPPMAIGVPEPSFGIIESHQRYVGESGYLDAGNGPYTHYIDNTASNCVNTGPGTADTPRCRLPRSVPAGSVIEIHGGPYTDQEYASTKREITLNGTLSQPVFVRGVAVSEGRNPQYLSTHFAVKGTYFVVENLILDATRLHVGKNEPVVFGAIRNSEIKNQPTHNAVQLYGRDIVFINNHVHHSLGDDRHGVKIFSGSKRVWVLNNEIHHNSGDGIQLCHNCKADPPEYVYIAGNHFYGNRENGVDLKWVNHVVISQNRIHGHKKAPRNTFWCFDDKSYCGSFSSGSDGSSIVVGSDGRPNDVLVLFNDIYDSNNGIRIKEGDGVIVAGNQTYNIDTAGLVLEKSGTSIYYFNNTLHNMEMGVKQKSGAAFDINVSNNIFSNINQPLRIQDSALADTMWLNNNLFWNEGNEVDIRWASDLTLRAGRQFNALPGRIKQGNQIANPRFIDAPGFNFNIGTGSQAIDNANDGLIELDIDYRNRFGHAKSILSDFNGLDRTNCAIDIGAYEYSCEADGTVPTLIELPRIRISQFEPLPTEPLPIEPPPIGPWLAIPNAIEAEKSYKPSGQFDYSASFEHEINVHLPEQVEVVEGRSGDEWLNVELARGAELMMCFYKGSGTKGKTRRPCSVPNGATYDFQYCLDQGSRRYDSCSRKPWKSKCGEAVSNGVTANDILSVDSVKLSIMDGDSCGITRVRMAL